MITAHQLRAARALLSIDQRQMAELADLSVPTIQRMEASDGVIRANVDSPDETGFRARERRNRVDQSGRRERDRRPRGAPARTCHKSQNKSQDKEQDHPPTEAGAGAGSIAFLTT